MSSFADPCFPPHAAVVDAVAVPPAPGQRASGRLEVPPGRVLWVGFLNLAFTFAALPVLAAVALLLLVLNPFLNPGPVFFRQERVGKGGRVFRIYKFRTMLAAPEGEASTSIADNESRITRLGGVLRKFRIDELPNFVNVALGDMNVIGPRPDAKEQSETYVRSVAGYRDRFEVRPGITGLAQVVHGYADCVESTRKKARYDRFYVRRRNAGLDVLLILRTVQVMCSGFGSR